MRSVRAIAELAGSAIANARSYQREIDTAKRLAEVDQLKTDFLGTVSHELRTPATAIMGFSTILATSWDTLDEGTRRELIGRIDRNAGSLSSMLNGLLDFARIERRSLQVERSELDLGAAVETIVQQTSSLMDQHTVEVRTTPGLRVWVDPQAVERILANLLTNAAKYSPPDTTITVEVRRVLDRVVLTVVDQGPGVTPEERGRIFSRFYRGDSDAATRTRGAGVGLAVVKELVDRSDATITIHDGPGGGARFVVSFPAGLPAPTLAGAPHAAPS
jgi:signal transduction histidine kinase